MSELDQTILLIDDDKLIVMSLERVLKKKGYKVIHTASPEKVVDLVGNEKVDLVILDFYLSDTSGIEILKSIRTVESFANIPIIMLTSEESPDIIEQCLDLGATDFIIKPIIPKVLLARIRSALLNRENFIENEIVLPIISVLI